MGIGGAQSSIANAPTGVRLYNFFKGTEEFRFKYTTYGHTGASTRLTGRRRQGWGRTTAGNVRGYRPEGKVPNGQ